MMKRPKRRERPVRAEDDPREQERRQQRQRSLWSFIFAIFVWFLLRPTNEPLAVGAAVVTVVAVYLFLGRREATRDVREAKRRERLERWAAEDEAEREDQPTG